MKLRHFTLPLVAAVALSLAACSKEDTTGAPGTAGASAADKAPIAAAQAYDVLSAQGKGFTAGALMSANTVFVLFDPQCPHCGHLWQAAEPLLGKARFVWLPVAFIGPKSLPQGAALLQAAQPQETMNAHERSLLAGEGGIGASSSIPDDIEAAIKTNTELLNRLGAESVPFIVAQSASGQPVLQAGSMDTAALAALLGLP